MNTAPVNVICLKWGQRYGPDYVNKLARAVARHLRRPYRFVCFTDDAAGIESAVTVYPIPEIDLPPKPFVTGWRKLCLFRDDLPIQGPTLFLDLDQIITGPLDPFFDFGGPDDIPIIHNWLPWRKTLFRADPMIGNSSVFRFEANRCRFVWDQFHREKEWALANFRPPQSYLTHCIRPRIKFWPAPWVRSFKRHCRPAFPLNLVLRPRLPAGASIIAFHGKPDPDEVLQDYRGEKIHHHTRAALWVAEHWK